MESAQGRFRPLLGPIVALATIGFVEALAWTPYRIPNAPAIILLVVVFSAFVSGLWPGLFTAGAAWAYFAYFFSIHGQSGQLFIWSTDDFRRVTIWAFATPAMALMVGVLKRRSEAIAREHGAMTEARESSLEVQQSHALFQGLFDFSPDALIVADSGGRIVRANGAAEKMFGYPWSELVGKPVEILVPERLRERHAGHRAGYAAAPRGRPMGSDRELLGRRKDGSELPVEVSLGPLETGNGTVVVAAVRDITERKRAEESLHRYGEIVRHMPAGLYVYRLEDPGDDRTLRLIAANPASARLTGVPVEGVLQRTLDENFPGLRAKSIPQRFAEVVRTGRPAEFGDLDYGDARVLRAAWSFRAFPLPGNCVGVAFEDTTPRLRAEEALRNAESLAAVGRLSSQVAHEINNPLTSLLGYLERIKTRVAEDPKSAEAAERVERSALRIRDLARDLLSLARTSRMEMGPVRLPVVLEESRKMLEPDLEKHGVRVEWKVPDSLPEIRGSGDHLQQAFSNMFINARQAMPSGGPLKVEAAADNGEVRISVTDTGVGIPQENLSKIFEPFFTTKPRGEGTGLGLAICQSVVSQHGGRIEVRSEPGKGSTFTVILPAGRDGGGAQ